MAALAQEADTCPHPDPLPQAGDGEEACREDDEIAIEWPSYDALLADKIVLAGASGIDVPDDAIHPYLKPHARDLALWALRGGRRAVFAAFGLAKTSIQLEWARQLALRTGATTLGVLPLGVRHGFMAEAKRLGMDVRFIRTNEEFRSAAVPAAAGETPALHFITNYESVRDGKLDPNLFGACHLDEASVLRSYGSKTYQEFLPLFDRVPFKLVATATPSPNRYKELIHYAGFLGVMDTGQALTRFFQRNSEQAGDLTLYPHKEEEFWLWVHSWAAFVQKPSDLGHSDEGYELPPLEVIWHEVQADHRRAAPERDGQGVMFRNAAAGVSQAAASKRDSLPARVQRMCEIIGLPSSSPACGGGAERSEGGGGAGVPLGGAEQVENTCPHPAPLPQAGEGEGAQAERAPYSSQDPARHLLLWHDLEGERHAIERAVPGVMSICGSEPIETRERRLADFEEGRVRHFATKPILSGSGSNFQYHCHEAIFLGIGFKFNDFIQACYRLQRFGQKYPVIIHLIYAEDERAVRAKLEEKWRLDIELRRRMSELIRKYGLAAVNARADMARSIGVVRKEERSAAVPAACARDARAPEWSWLVANNDAVAEARRWPDRSVDLIVTSIPFGTQYEYAESFNDFGHNADNAAFWRQMDHLTPQLLRMLAPGRMACIHVKDRIRFGGVTGAGLPTVEPFHAEAIFHYRAHGFDYVGMVTIVTDVVRENGQTYRLGWTENVKDSTRMGVGMPEYLLLFHKPQSDRSRGYADVPVTKRKPDIELPSSPLPSIRAFTPVFDGLCGERPGEGQPPHSGTNDALCGDGPSPRPSPREGRGEGVGTIVPWSKEAASRPGAKMVPGTGYSRARWQIDAHAMWRSSGNRFLTRAEWQGLPAAEHARLFAKISAARIYDYAEHVAIGEALERDGSLPAKFMAIMPGSYREDVWHDVVRMRTLNTVQAAQGREKHICPLQFDVVDRAIVRFSNPGELVYDPFCGLGTVPVRALALGRRGAGSELNEATWRDSVAHLRAAEERLAVPALFDLDEMGAGATGGAAMEDEE